MCLPGPSRAMSRHPINAPGSTLERFPRRSPQSTRRPQPAGGRTEGTFAAPVTIAMLADRLSLYCGERPRAGVRVRRAGAHRPAGAAGASVCAAMGGLSLPAVTTTRGVHAERWRSHAHGLRALFQRRPARHTTTDHFPSLATYKVGEPPPPTAAAHRSAVKRGALAHTAEGRAYSSALRCPAFSLFETGAPTTGVCRGTHSPRRCSPNGRAT